MYLKSWFRGSCLLTSVSDILHPHTNDVRVGGLVHLTLSCGVTLQHGLEKVKVVLHCRQLHVGRIYGCRYRRERWEVERERERERE